MNVLFSANAAVQEVVPAVVQRQAAAIGKPSMRVLDMLRAPHRA
jgi:hypothetical protein